MNYHSDDALDQALLALSLEEPPIGLRQSILAATVYRPAPVFSTLEIIELGVLGAVMVWLVTLVVLGGGALFTQTLHAFGMLLGRVMNVTTVLWLAAGGAIALWLSLFTGFQPLLARAHKVGAPPHR